MSTIRESPLESSLVSGYTSKKHLFQVAISFVIGITSPALSGQFQDPIDQAVIDNIMVCKLEEIRKVWCKCDICSVLSRLQSSWVCPKSTSLQANCKPFWQQEIYYALSCLQCH